MHTICPAPITPSLLTSAAAEATGEVLKVRTPEAVGPAAENCRPTAARNIMGSMTDSWDETGRKNIDNRQNRCL